MRYVLMTFVSKERIDEWEAAGREDRLAHIDDVMAWFRTYGEKGWIAGGAELTGRRMQRRLAVEA